MTDKILCILQHSIGADAYGNGGGYRNHFVTSEGSTDHPHCLEAVEKGWMYVQPMSEALTGGNGCFVVTQAGRAYIAAHSQPVPSRKRASVTKGVNHA
jgi:hypothetical protein